MAKWVKAFPLYNGWEFESQSGQLVRGKFSVIEIYFLSGNRLVAQVVASFPAISMVQSLWYGAIKWLEKVIDGDRNLLSGSDST